MKVHLKHHGIHECANRAHQEHFYRQIQKGLEVSGDANQISIKKEGIPVVTIWRKGVQQHKLRQILAPIGGNADLEKFVSELMKKMPKKNQHKHHHHKPKHHRPKINPYPMPWPIGPFVEPWQDHA